MQIAIMRTTKHAAKDPFKANAYIGLGRYERSPTTMRRGGRILFKAFATRDIGKKLEECYWQKLPQKFSANAKK
jgi:hypothetical protein